MEYPGLRKYIREMLEERYQRHLQEEKAPQAEGKVPNTESSKAVSVKGDPLHDVKLNQLVKNPKMAKKGFRPRQMDSPNNF